MDYNDSQPGETMPRAAIIVSKAVLTAELFSKMETGDDLPDVICIYSSAEGA